MDKEAEIGFNYGILATTDGVCHVGLYPVENTSGCRRTQGEGQDPFRPSQQKMKLEDINLKLLEMELKMCPDFTPEEKFEIYLYRRSCVTMVEMLQYVGLYNSDL